MTTYKLTTIGAETLVTGTVEDAIDAARVMDDLYRRPYGVTIEVCDRLVATVLDGEVIREVDE